MAVFLLPLSLTQFSSRITEIDERRREEPYTPTCLKSWRISININEFTMQCVINETDALYVRTTLLTYLLTYLAALASSDMI